MSGLKSILDAVGILYMFLIKKRSIVVFLKVSH